MTKLTETTETKFTDLNLAPKVLRAIADAGYETPTPIQAGAIPPALEGRDVLGIAQTGTGKTAAFTLPAITMLSKGRARARMPRSLVLAPTRELAAQVAENFDIYAKYTKLTKALLIGGVSFKEQDRLIDRGVDVLIATPGRLLDHFERGKLLLTGVQIMVVDEADRMLDMGFIPDIERIFNLTPFTRQTLFFSATMAPEIERITNTFLSNAAKIEVARAATTGENIDQSVMMFTPSRRERAGTEKRDMLRAVIAGEGDGLTNAIIFCNRKSDVDIVAKSLKQHGLNAEPIHGDLEQSRRMKVLQGFRDGEIKFLCASDVAARGLDIPNVSHILNFDVPSHAEDYVHRIGRTGRAGRKGKTVMICAPSDQKNLDAIERLVKQKIPRADSPSAQKSAGRATAPTKASATQTNAAKTSAAKTSAAETSATQTNAAETNAAAPFSEKPRRSRKPAPKRENAPRKSDTAEATQNQPAQNQPAQNQTAQNQTVREKTRDPSRTPARGRSHTPVGMGDHLPDFIAKSFGDRRGQ